MLCSFTGFTRWFRWPGSLTSWPSWGFPIGSCPWVFKGIHWKADSCIATPEWMHQYLWRCIGWVSRFESPPLFSCPWAFEHHWDTFVLLASWWVLLLAGSTLNSLWEAWQIWNACKDIAGRFLLPLWKAGCIYTISATLHVSRKVPELVHLGREREEEREGQHGCHPLFIVIEI